MEDINKVPSDKVKSIEISENMEKSFLSYAMSVIVSRALPDVRDGLKPVHRRIIYAMDELNARPNVAHKKSARIVGDVLGKYHPHGDSSVYDAMVRLAQDFSSRYPLVDGRGNFGSIDGDGAAAQRYTEARMASLSVEMMRDIKKETVDLTPNYTNEFNEPTVLPSKFPNLLVNGSMGIAVGMATNIPPHNLSEVIDGCINYIDNNEITNKELMNYIKGPDFPTGASILGNSGILKAYETGKGSISIRANAEIVETKNKSQIIITDVPYQVNKKNLITKIGELVKEKSLEGISNLTDETNLAGIKIVIDLKKEANANVVLNNLYRQTALQTSYGINLLAIVHGEPKILTLKDMIKHYVNHQKEIIIRRTKYDLKIAEKRLHILEGLKIALENLDEVIKIIRGSRQDAEAKEKLKQNFNLTDVQSEAILEMKLRRLTSLEINKVIEEHESLLKLIEELKEILGSEEKVLNIIKEELNSIKQKFGDERRTNIDMTAIEYIEDESLIPEENIMVSLTTNGYIKRTNTSVYRSQNRGGVGVKGMTTNEEDSVEELINLSTHDFILFFTNKGKVYRLKGYEIPEFSRIAKGIPVINLLQLDKEETINSVIFLSTDSKAKYFVFGTKLGLVKRTLISEFESIRVNGKICITLNEDDELIGVRKSDGTNNVLLGSTDGRMVVFDEEEVRSMGRTAKGVKGINLNPDEECIGLEVADDDSNILMVTKKGYGKKTQITEYRKTKRASKGVKALNITEKNGKLLTFKKTKLNSDLMIITGSGVIIRLPLDQVSQLGRVTQGTRLINLKEDQEVSSISLIINEEELEKDDPEVESDIY